ncbi:MAG: hypothetical protein AAGD35_02185 [Actinomycetota bacterium]
MTFSLKDWAEAAVKQRGMVTPPAFGGAQVTYTVSKTVKGDWRNDPLTSSCVNPEDCHHLHLFGTLDCAMASGRCDSDVSRDYLQGKVTAGFAAVFGHADAAQSGSEAIEERGYYSGPFDVEGEKSMATGVLDGIANVGIVRNPLEPAIEECRRPGRWHAALELSETEEVALVMASTAFDVDYRITSSWIGVEFVGTVEGMIIRECRGT